MSVNVTANHWVLKTESNPGMPFNFNMGTPEATFEMVSKKLSSDDLKEGDVLLQTIYLANDPAQKFWIISSDKNYAKGVPVGEVIPSRGLARVIASRNDAIKVGSIARCYTGWTTHFIVTKDNVAQLEILPALGDGNGGVEHLWWYLSVLGSTALTAYFIMYRYLELDDTEASQGKVFLISGAAGAVGSTCVQLALNVFKAKKVIAIAGGPEKIKYVESFGDAVVGVDYKDPNFKENLMKAAGGANVADYFIDNVGGDILDLGVVLLKVHGTIAVCGSISAYNDPSKFAFKNYITVLTKRLTIRGLLVTDNREKFVEASKKLLQWIKEGKYSPDNSATIKDARGDKFSEVPLIWNGLFSGINKGKLITQVSEE